MTETVRHERAIDRASPTDRAFLAMDTGRVPEQFGVVLRTDQVGPIDLTWIRQLLAERVPAVPRLRQRLFRVPLGCGGPIWVDDDAFDIRRHVRAVACSAPGDERALLDTAISVIATPLPRDAPVWSAVCVTGLSGGGFALVVVLHHVLADGVGGLAVLANLVDGVSVTTPNDFPRPRPTRGELARQALLDRLRALRRGRAVWRLLRASMSAGGGLRPPQAAPCSLVQRTGPRLAAAVVRVDLDTLRPVAHRHGATTNDALLVAVAGALHRVLTGRGESVDRLAIAVPVSGRTVAGPELGNMVAPLLVQVPTSGEVGLRLRTVAAEVRAHKAEATGPPPIAVLGWLFRPLAALGGYRWYMNHQRRLHTLVSHVRVPGGQLTFDGSPIVSAMSLALADGGNMTVCFDVVSYAGTMTVTAIVDPDHFPDLETLTAGLRTELDELCHDGSNAPGSGQ
ncbi:wax ester/triacylglycerol synthase domain-containing protein [Actinokineospora sp. HUAS TT18]|uniref:wax ester/triacylglycerol synthase domain-containing protein n=1 Tax=Actinokineospora sp. HUAS TT18 TaxID=3447451 RepID=UPI003F5237BD